MIAVYSVNVRGDDEDEQSKKRKTYGTVRCSIDEEKKQCSVSHLRRYIHVSLDTIYIYIYNITEMYSHEQNTRKKKDKEETT